MTRTLAAVAAALLAMGARAQTAAPQADPAAPPAEPAAPKAAPAPKAEEKPKGTFVIGEKSLISITGRAWAELHRISAGAQDSASGPRWRVHNNASYLRIRGERRLDEGWKAIAQVEAEFGIEGEAGTPFSGTRNAGVGLDSPYGTLILGRWDSPTKVTTLSLDPFIGTGVFGYYNVFGQQIVAPGKAGANRWDRRLTNGAFYTSPTVNGLTLLAAYSVGETKRGPAPATGNALPVHPYVYNVALHYKSGPLYLGASYEVRRDCGNPDANPGAPACNSAALGSAAQPNGTDAALRLGAGLTLKPTRTKLGAAFERVMLEADQLGTAHKKTLQRNAFFGSITQGLLSDRHQLIFNYGKASSVTGEYVFANKSSTGAYYLTAAYRFWLDKDTDVYAAFTEVMNQKNALYVIGSGNFADVTLTTAGMTSKAYGVGMRYMF